LNLSQRLKDGLIGLPRDEVRTLQRRNLHVVIATIEADLKGLAKELPHSEWCSFVTDERGPREGMCDCYVSKHIAAIEHYTRL
jgi:hypothetical protein